MKAGAYQQPTASTTLSSTNKKHHQIMLLTAYGRQQAGHKKKPVSPAAVSHTTQGSPSAMNRSSGRKATPTSS